MQRPTVANTMILMAEASSVQSESTSLISEQGSDLIESTSLISEQGSDLIDLRLTWREMENWIFGDILGDFWRIIGEIGWL